MLPSSSNLTAFLVLALVIIVVPGPGVLFTIGKSALGLYFGKADPGSGYGAAGSIILILLWVSYSSMILFFGAEFTHTYTDMREGVKPSETGKPLEVDKSHL